MTTRSREIYFTPEGIEIKRPKFWVARQQNRGRSIGKLSTVGGGETAEYEVDLISLPDGLPNFDVDRDSDGVLDGFISNNIYIPPFASIKSVTVFTREVAVGGASIDIGLFRFDGTPVDPAGLATVTAADMAVRGQRFEGAGVLTVPATASVGENAVTIGLTGTGEWTEGRIQINVEYDLNQQSDYRENEANYD